MNAGQTDWNEVVSRKAAFGSNRGEAASRLSGDAAGTVEVCNWVESGPIDRPSVGSVALGRSAEQR